MKWLVALLLALPLLANGACYTHPDSGVTYCTSAQECPSGTSWNAPTQACSTKQQEDRASIYACEILIYYPKISPPRPYIQTTEACDLALAKRSLATILAELLSEP